MSDHPGDLPDSAKERLPDPPDQQERKQEIQDKDGYNLQKSLERLQHRRDVVSSVQDRIVAIQLEGADERRVKRGYRTAIAAAIVEYKPHLTNADLDTSVDYWEEKEIGTHEIAPPSVLQEHGPVARLERPATAEAVEFVGLRDIWGAPSPLTVEFTADFVSPVDVNEVKGELAPNEYTLNGDGRHFTVTVAKQEEVPLEILHNAATALAEFSQEIGIDAKLDDGRGMGNYS